MSSSAKLIFGGLFSGIGQGVTSYGGMMRDAKMSALKRERKEADEAKAITRTEKMREEDRAFALKRDEAREVAATTREKTRGLMAEKTATTAFGRQKELGKLAGERGKETAKVTASARLEEQKRQSYLRARDGLRKAFDKKIEEEGYTPKEAELLEKEFAMRDDALLKRINSLYDPEEIKAADKEIEAAFETDRTDLLTKQIQDTSELKSGATSKGQYTLQQTELISKAQSFRAKGMSDEEINKRLAPYGLSVSDL